MWTAWSWRTLVLGAVPVLASLSDSHLCAYSSPVHSPQTAGPGALLAPLPTSACLLDLPHSWLSAPALNSTSFWPFKCSNLRWLVSGPGWWGTSVSAGGRLVVISSFSFGLAGCCWLSSCAAFVSQAHNSEWYWFSSCAPGVSGPLSGEGDAGRWRSQPFNPLLMSSPLLLILFMQWGPALDLAWKGTSVARETERSLRKPKPQVKAHYVWPFAQRLGCAGNRTRCIFSNCLLQVGDLEPGCLDLFTWLHYLYAICVTLCKILVLLRPKLNGSSFTKWEG